MLGGARFRASHLGVTYATESPVFASNAKFYLDQDGMNLIWVFAGSGHPVFCWLLKPPRLSDAGYRRHDE